MRRASAHGPRSRKPRTVVDASRRSRASYSAEDIRQDLSYLIVAERTNTNGSRQFKRLLQEENWDGLVSMARDEVRDGSHMLDVCVDFVGRDGVRDMHEVVKRYVNRRVNVPLMLDSTNPAVMEAGLKLAGGRCILNSMNLEDGEEKLGQICALAKKYGAAVVAGTIDEDKLNAMAHGGAKDLHRQSASARQSHDSSIAARWPPAEWPATTTAAPGSPPNPAAWRQTQASACTSRRTMSSTPAHGAGPRSSAAPPSPRRRRTAARRTTGRACRARAR